MKIKLICIGKTTEAYLKEGIKIYAERIKHFLPFEIVEIQDIKTKNTTNINFIKDKEAEAVQKLINQGDIVILLDENGKEFDSKSFALFIEKNSVQNAKCMVFIIGGAFGFSDKLYQSATHKISLSQMTFTHQMVRLIFAEQLYRGLTIIKNIPYHNQ